MTWNDVNHKHHGLTAEVKTPAGWSRRELHIGRIRCEAQGVIPCLVTGDEKVHMFAGWHVVELID